MKIENFKRAMQIDSEIRRLSDIKIRLESGGHIAIYHRGDWVMGVKVEDGDVVPVIAPDPDVNRKIKNAFLECHKTISGIIGDEIKKLNDEFDTL